MLLVLATIALATTESGLSAYMKQQKPKANNQQTTKTTVSESVLDHLEEQKFSEQRSAAMSVLDNKNVVGRNTNLQQTDLNDVKLLLSLPVSQQEILQKLAPERQSEFFDLPSGSQIQYVGFSMPPTPGPPTVMATAAPTNYAAPTKIYAASAQDIMDSWTASELQQFMSLPGFLLPPTPKSTPPTPLSPTPPAATPAPPMVVSAPPTETSRTVWIDKVRRSESGPAWTAVQAPSVRVVLAPSTETKATLQTMAVTAHTESGSGFATKLGLGCAAAAGLAAVVLVVSALIKIRTSTSTKEENAAHVLSLSPSFACDAL
jgi:hypothetical protein